MTLEGAKGRIDKVTNRESATGDRRNPYDNNSPAKGGENLTGFLEAEGAGMRGRRVRIRVAQGIGRNKGSHITPTTKEVKPLAPPKSPAITTNKVKNAGMYDYISNSNDGTDNLTDILERISRRQKEVGESIAAVEAEMQQTIPEQYPAEHLASSIEKSWGNDDAETLYARRREKEIKDHIEGTARSVVDKGDFLNALDGEKNEEKVPQNVSQVIPPPSEPNADVPKTTTPAHNEEPIVVSSETQRRDQEIREMRERVYREMDEVERNFKFFLVYLDGDVARKYVEDQLNYLRNILHLDQKGEFVDRMNLNFSILAPQEAAEIEARYKEIYRQAKEAFDAKFNAATETEKISDLELERADLRERLNELISSADSDIRDNFLTLNRETRDTIDVEATRINLTTWLRDILFIDPYGSVDTERLGVNILSSAEADEYIYTFQRMYSNAISEFDDRFGPVNTSDTPPGPIPGPAETPDQVADLEKVIADAQAQLALNNAELAAIRAKKNRQEAQQTEIYGFDFVEIKLLGLLNASEKIDEIKIPPKIIPGPGNGEVTFNASVVADGNNIGIKAIIQNQRDSITIKGEPKIDASWAVKTFGGVGEKIKKAPGILKKYIEDESGKKVKKMEIVDNGLKVTYEA